MCEFLKSKQRILLSIDNSKKGSVDELICDLVSCINNLSHFVSTSSCSGRIIVVQQTHGVIHEVERLLFQIDDKRKKQSCNWLFTSHALVDSKDLITSLSDGNIANAVLKFEPFVLHVQCADLEKARKLHSCAIASGFRNSGISISNKNKIIAAVRSTHGLEVPISDDERLLVENEYLEFLVRIANGKMMENEKRIKRFEECFKKEFLTSEEIS